MDAIPWRRVSFWECSTCGECCRWFKVPLMINEFNSILDDYGQSAVDVENERAYLTKRPDGRCAFQFPSCNRWVCGLQKNKPIACKLWPFLVMEEPEYGHSDLAVFKWNDSRHYVYVDLKCKGVSVGRQSRIIAEKVLPELIRLIFVTRRTQTFSTSMLGDYPIADSTDQHELVVLQNLS